MEIREWNRRYRLREHETSDFDSPPTPLLVETAKQVPPGKALDLASGTGRNALWLAEQGWDVTAVDGASEAIDTLRERSAKRFLKIETVLADLEKTADVENPEFKMEPSRWDLIAMCYYLQRDLFEPAKQGVKPGGILISIIHITEPGEEPTGHRLKPGELEQYFAGWEILHRHEGMANDAPHRRPVAEIVARRPASR